jgi:hypothetical protein
MEYFC